MWLAVSLKKGYLPAIKKSRAFDYLYFVASVGNANYTDRDIYYFEIRVKYLTIMVH